MAAVKTENAKTGSGEAQGTGGALGKQKESVYTMEELAANAEAVFHTSPECVSAALRQAGITECTKGKAEEIVKEFRGRKVE